MDNTAKNSVATTNAGLVPVGAIFNVYGKKFEEFISDFLRSKEIANVLDVRLVVKNAGTNHATPRIYAFFGRNTNIVSSDRSSVAPYLAKKLEGANSVKLSNEGKNRLAAVINLNRLNTGSAPDNEIFVELDLFRCLGLFLGASYRQHKLTVFEINSINGEVVLTVIKQEVPKTSFGMGNADKRAQFIDKQNRY